MFSNLFSNAPDLMQAWVWAMIHSVWIGLVLAFVFYSWLGLSPRASARSKYRVGMSLMLLMPAFVLLAFLLSIPEPQTAGLVQAVVGDPIHAVQAPVLENKAYASMASLWMSKIENHVQLIFLIWSLGVILFSLRMALGYHQIGRLRKEVQAIELPALVRQFSDLVRRSGIRKKITLASSLRVDVPVTLGHLKPVILLPIGLINHLSPEETKAILAHEIAHIMRRDYLQNVLISTLEILFFYHPSVWWFSATIKTIREQCCDDLALELGAEPIALSKALIRLEEQATAPTFALAFAHKNQLLHRVQRLFKNPIRNEYRMSRGQAPLLVCGLALVWLFSSPLESLGNYDNAMRLSKSFIWDTGRAAADTVKPKSRIEKISRDNGKQKVEISLENKEIKELKVDDKVIPPSEYEKYKGETDALKKELSEIEMPERRGRVFRDYEPGEYHFNYNFNFDDSLGIVDIPTVFPKGSLHPRVYSIRPRVEVKPGERRAFTFRDRDGHERSLFFQDGDRIRGMRHNGTKWIFEGDSSGMRLDGDRLIIEDKDGNIIIDLGKEKNWPGGRMRMFGPGTFEFNLDKSSDLFHGRLEDLENLHLKIPDESMEKAMKHLDREKLRIKEGQHEMREKLRMSEEQLKELMEDMGHGFREIPDFEWEEPLRRSGKVFSLGRKNNLQQAVERQLDRDNLVEKGKSYEFKITSKDLRINGKKQDAQRYKQFKSLVEEHTGIELEEGSVIQFSGSLDQK
ncbi:MAG TPA: M56 family metallopeptidase [Saprospiraceae bacterium]|nr:M56 family metallopeptidase [Saprospiraceae bacterium]HNT20848.1 M56 family metallopeptidase [Saprospiraceae bacterium]